MNWAILLRIKNSWFRMTTAIIVIFLSLSLESCSHTTPPADNGVDTTSHAFTWSIETLGEGAGSMLYDAAVVNDTLAYAVGEIYLRDSSGQVDPILYNLARWNGNHWEIKRATVMFRGNSVTLPLEGIFVRSAGDIWLAGSIPIHGNGESWTGYDIQALVGAGATVSRIWGNSSEVYFVGRAGNVIQYNGNTWERFESGTTLDIHDIWGATNPYTGATEILAVASNETDKRILLIQGTSVIPLPDSGLANTLNSVWFVSESRYYIVGAGISQKQSLQDARWQTFDPGVVTSYVSGGVRGTGVNDVFVAGSFFEVVHFNGSTWHNYRDQIPYSEGAVGRIAVKGNLMITVGLMGQKAVAIIGRRR